MDGIVGAPSRMEVLVGLAVGWLQGEGADMAGGPEATVGARSLRRTYRGRACQRFPVLAAFSTLDERLWRGADTRFELIGMARSETGLGQNLWMSAKALSWVGLDPLIRDSEAGFALIDGSDGSAPDRGPGAGGTSRRTAKARRKAALIHLNADAAPQALCHPLVDRHPDLHAIGFLLWELEALPRAHHLALDLLDEIWCPSRFVADIYAAHTATPVHTVGKAISLPEPAPLQRQSLGLGPDDDVFLVTFDFHSSVERKNPIAAVQAFHHAFGKPSRRLRRPRLAPRRRARPRLVIKTTPPVEGHWGDPNGMWQAIKTAAEADDRILIIDRRLSFEALLGLVALSDALISPHRSEGFGYMPAYALALGRPVIATD
ncbi:MAG: hypothetical protein AAF899_16225, partial [Pseudomonadota bacterium]